METQVSSWKERIFLLVLLSLLAMLILTPLTSNHAVPGAGDYGIHVTLIVQAKEALREGQIFLRETFYKGLRYPLFQFYSPTRFTLVGLTYLWLTPASPFLAEKIVQWFFLVIGGIYIYRLAMQFVKSPPAATLAAVLYMTLPYYLIVLNYVGAMSEANALGFFPAVLYYTFQRYLNPTDTKTLLKTALAWYLLITIHLVTFADASFFLGLLLLLMTCRNHQWMNLIDVGIAYVFGCLLAFWYLVPIASMHQLFNINDTLLNGNIYTRYKSTLASLFSLTGSIASKSTDMHFLAIFHPNLGLPLVFILFSCTFMLVKKITGRKRILVNKNFDNWFPILFCVFILDFLLVWSPINIWKYLPTSFLIFQYTWRLLAQMMWSGALLFAGVLCWIFKNKMTARHTVIGVILLVLATIPWFPTGARWGYNPLPNLNDYRNYEIDSDYQLDIHNKGFVPVQLDFNKNNSQHDIVKQVLAQLPKNFNVDGTLLVSDVIKYCDQDKETTVCKLQVPAGIQQVQLPFMFYPDMIDLTINGKPAEIQSAPDDGRLVVLIKSLPDQINVIKIKFVGIPWANLLSQITWGVWGVYFCLIYGRSMLRFL
jgi:hypothetical protein